MTTRRTENRISVLPLMDLFKDRQSEEYRIWRQFLLGLNRQLELTRQSLQEKAFADRAFFIFPLNAAEMGTHHKVYGPVPWKHTVLGGRLVCAGTMPATGVTMEVTWSADGLYSTTTAITVVAPVGPETKQKDLSIVSTGATVEANATYAINTAGGSVTEPRLVLIARMDE